MSNSVGVVILARYSSSRLPGKALKVLAGDTVLGHIINRVSSVIDPSQIVLATSDEASDDALETFARERDIRCYRGSLTRVGERFEGALSMLNVDYGIRMNGDNVFLDPALLKTVIAECELGEFDFISNVLGRTFPKGMSVEAVRHSYYRERLPQIKADAYCNEHVMVCLYDESEPVNHMYIKNIELPEAAGIQLALDTPDDWNRSVWMMENMPNGKYDLKTTFEYAKKYEATVER